MQRGLFPVDIGNILINENAYFYVLIEELTFDVVSECFSQSLKDKEAVRVFSPVIRRSILDGNKEVGKYSLDIFKFVQKPSFFKKWDPNFLETRFGYFLIIESNGYVAILKKYVSGVEMLNSIIEQIDYNILAHFLVQENTKFEKVTSSNMNTAELAIQRKSFEALDLKNIFSRFGASKQVLNLLRIDNEGLKSSIALNTSRVNTLNLKTDLSKILDWSLKILTHIRNANNVLPKSGFLDGFAKPIKFEEGIKNLKPTYILLRFGELKDDIDSGLIEKCYIKTDEEEKSLQIGSVIKANEKLLELKEIDDKEYSNGDLHVKINEKSITISSEKFKDIILVYGNDRETTLNQYFNNKNSFIINFNKIDFIYTHRKIFHDSKLLGDIENFLTTFLPFDKLGKVISEKGSGYTNMSDSFSKDSLFYFIENDLAAKHKCLICDDMGAEWGDFISLNDEEIVFYHAKFHTSSLSATNLEEVFGQAQKNFGYLALSEEMISYRSSRWLRNYKIDGITTKISRIRRCLNPQDPIKSIKSYNDTVSSNPNLRRKVFIVISFLSKKELSDSIIKVKKGNYFENQGVTAQILWFVNSLLASANDLGAEFRIICKP
jgi:hypothetical protein